MLIGLSAKSSTSITRFLIVLACHGFAGIADGQTSYRGTDGGGFQPHHGYLSFEPFEQLDTTTGNLVLTFTDLVLAGNAGRNLVFQRTYNNLPITSPANPQDQWRWTYGFPGMVMRIIEQTPSSWPSTLNTMIAQTPIYVMADGAIRRTVYKTYLDTNWVTDAYFLKYDRTNRVLYMPDGTVCQYNAQGYLIAFEDPFGNAVTLDRTSTPGAVIITQTVGTQSREVRWDLYGDGQLNHMTYGARHWEYQFIGLNAQAVIPPLGPAWTFTYYGTGYLATITTPGGGQITYQYLDTNGRLSQRQRGGAGVTPGTWFINSSFPSGEPLASSISIGTPSGAAHSYVNYTTAPAVALLGGGTGFLTRTVGVGAGAYVEREERGYVAPPVVELDGTSYNSPEIGSHTLTHRSDPANPATARSHQTTLYYSYGGMEGSSDYHHPYETYTVNSGDPSPVTRSFTYLHLQTPYIVALPMSETNTGTGMLTSRVYDMSTGFMQASSVVPIGSPAEYTGYAPDSYGNVTTVTRPNGKTTTMTYLWGRVSSIQGQPSGSLTTYAINPDGTVQSETSAGRTTSYGYDALSRLTSTQGPGGTNPITIDYDNIANQFVATHRGQSTSTTYVDGFGAPLEKVDGSGVRVRTGYDAAGRATYQGYPYTPGAPLFNTDKGTSVTYDVLDRPLVVTHPDQTTVTTTYGNSTITTVNERGFSSTQTINGRDEMVSLTDADGKVWNYTYHPAGQLHQIIGPVGLPESVTRTWEYDAKQQLASETHPESGTLTYEEYDAAGMLKRTRDASGNSVSLTYDGDDRIATVAAGPRVTTFTYETGSDNIVQLSVTATPTAPAVTTVFEYDTAGRVKKRVDTVDGKAFESRYAYDLNDNLKEVVYPSLRRVGYDYDIHNRLTRVYNLDTDASYATAFTYDGAGALRSYTMGNGIATTLSHDSDSYRLSAIDSGALQLTYAYDNAGNVGTIGDSRSGMGQTFTYDNLDRLKTATGPYGYSVHDYDAHGNRQTSPGGTPYGYDPNNRFRLTSIGGAGNYQYLPNGNLASETGGTYAYTRDSLLDSTTLNSVTTRFAYDGQGWRVRKLVEEGPTYYYSRAAGGQLLSEWMNTSASTATARDYVYAGSTLLSVVTRTDLQPK